MDFVIIPILENEAFNYFFSLAFWLGIITLPFIAVFSILATKFLK